MSDLLICRLSDASASVLGGKEIILLCEKVTKGNIKLYFISECILLLFVFIIQMIFK